jgi:AcrR family transcriptional regulator
MKMKDPVKRAPGRPRAFDREGALKAAMILFWRNGYEGTSMAQLTAAMGINAPSLYAAFESKEKLYREALTLYLGSLGNIGVGALEECASAREGVQNVLEQAASAFTRRDCPSGCMVGSGALRGAEENQVVVQETAALRRMAQEATERRFKRAIADGELAPDTNFKALTAFYSTVVQGMSVQAQDGATRNDLLRVVNVAMAAWPSAPAKRKAKG